MHGNFGVTAMLGSMMWWDQINSDRSLLNRCRDGKRIFFYFKKSSYQFQDFSFNPAFDAHKITGGKPEFGIPDGKIVTRGWYLVLAFMDLVNLRKYGQKYD